ncbi:TMEM175 family protein [Cognatilysobacter lacus]|uniref:DUF1211 domain-containing protein n=1 Tax=Cognatilysobacter lacus TaxID=1643323 RepID=A0A5D8Z2H9_9GAMM|nr:TMEM175 family protein [Lysobacter lacus]TZF88746.1 DUF1211 domain-containing protein [Lysobacter lacus]
MRETTDHPLERMVFFSDAVFAIAITLLVIEVHVPVIPRSAPDVEFWLGMLRLTPNLIGYFISFGVIGAFWMGHHRAFALATRYTPKVMGWNLLFLGCIAFMPFVTAFMSEYEGKRVPATLYWGWMVLTALLNLRLNALAVSPIMRARETTDEDARYIRARGLATVVASVCALVLAQFVPILAPLAMATMAIWRRVFYRAVPPVHVTGHG